MKVAFHVDQLWFDAPGGIGTYVAELLKALPASDDSVTLTPFYSRSGRDRSSLPGTPLTTDGRYPGVEVPGSIRMLYPSWDLLGRPALMGWIDSAKMAGYAAGLADRGRGTR